MRIEDRYISGPDPLAGKRADGSGPNSGSGVEGSGDSGGVDDAVSLSGLARRAAEELPTERAQREANVERLRAEYQNGTYRVDVQELARNLAGKILGE